MLLDDERNELYAEAIDLAVADLTAQRNNPVIQLEKKREKPIKNNFSEVVFPNCWLLDANVKTQQI